VHLTSRVRATPSAPGRPFAADESRRFAHWIGLAFLAGGIVGVIALVFPPAPFSVLGISWSAAGLAIATGIVLVSGVADRASRTALQVLLAYGTMLAAAGVYGAGSPVSGAQLFFLWIIPFAFAFFTPRQAATQMALMASSYALVLAIQVNEHPAIGSAGLLIGMWIIVVSTAGVVGFLVRRLSRSLREADHRFERSFHDSPIGGAFLSKDLVYLEVNNAFCELLGRDRESIVGHSTLEFTYRDDYEMTAGYLDADPSDDLVELEKRFVRPDGSIVWARISSAFVETERGARYRFTQFQDITDHRRDRESLEHQAIHDPLTGLFNRTLFLDRLATALRRGNPAGRVAVIMLDLDRFKVLNDSLGHHVGDELLSAVAPRLAAAISPSDTLARFGGDEFVVLCDQLRSPMEVVDRAEKLASALSAPIELKIGSYVVGASMGIAVAGHTDVEALSLLRDADSAMYRAKAKGRNRIEVFNQPMRDEAIERLELERDLRDAVERDELFLEYQPVVDADTGQPVFLEALVRWQHPTRGRLEPYDFIPLAEETGLIFDIGRWVLAESLRQLALWQSMLPSDPPLGVSVNVSGRQFADSRLCDAVVELVRGSGIAPYSLGIEITESVLFAPDSPGGTIDTLRSLGVRILLDDFGTGYSSLAYLERFPIDILKVDQSFVARLTTGTKGIVVLKAILALAQALGIRVVAEGVEQPATIETLRSLGCTWLQGWAITKALRADDVINFLNERRTVARALGYPADRSLPI
jgi:diguanylate cyclase (GGDEF)-like protein/PAS domain S-box-containing protein